MKIFDFSKAAVALSLVGLLSSVAMADSIDEEIAKLKKENELLELKKKNAKLQKGSSIEFSNVVESDEEDYRSSLNGFFVGAEVGYSPSVQNYMSVKTGSNYDYDYPKTYALPINLAFGYQLYPWQNAGFKFRGYVGYASYDSPTLINDPSGTNPMNKNDKQLSSALHYGLEAEYLYDFIASQKHTLGLNVGLGYEFGTFIGQGMQYTEENNTIGTEKLKSYTNSSFTSSLGVHYYYNINHQFELKYRYRGGYAQSNGGSQTINGVKVEYATTPSGSILFAYNYKF